tara:strand:+ start:159 stop:347 length:189 start_codon:yes stop_codon:yes gene_type:complete
VRIMAKKRQTRKQITAGKYYKNVKTKDSIIGMRFPLISEMSRKERKTTFQTIMENWFGHIKD